ncbi:MAG: ABC transporter ATP-binding protein [Theionarchaea archaeon]|nr:ABC transporter ATP-binding protein [Theionarchaea archaeon]MBU7020281.1 ABC transporter ATP-binding protein [Theionarchaea archaeon]MBU7035174.1 ABC transporter ATP-binding protein [Theionarchaea archaeon]MBU7041499.1 ABC transporter ATP-binding protein [Theionarchaea archaeon]
MLAVKTENLEMQFTMGDTVVNALRGVTLTMDEGEFISIVGTSGSGKSTLLNLVGGLMKPSGGKVFVKGEDLSVMNENNLALFRRKYIGFVFQSFNLVSTLTAVENVELPLIFSNSSASEREKKVTALLTELGLEDRLHHKPTELSGGQQQRVSIARAIINNPEIILADEPTGNLDSKTSQEIMDVLYALNRKGQTFLVVTHDMNVAHYGNRIIYLTDGQVTRIEEVRT